MAYSSTAFVGDIPDAYDTGLGPNIFEHYALQMAVAVGAKMPSEVLELAAGTGIVTKRLREALDPGTHLVATDLNEDMLLVAQNKFDGPDNIAFQTANAQELPFADNSFDVVTTQFGHMFFPDRPAAYSEAQRVIRPGGTYFFSTWGVSGENPFSQVAQDVMTEAFRDDPPGFYNVPFSMGDPDAVLSEMKAAGLKGASHRALIHKQVVDDMDNFARGLVFGNPSFLELQERGVDPLEVQNDMALSLRERLGEEPARMPLLAHLFTAEID